MPRSSNYAPKTLAVKGHVVFLFPSAPKREKRGKYFDWEAHLASPCRETLQHVAQPDWLCNISRCSHPTAYLHACARDVTSLCINFLIFHLIVLLIHSATTAIRKNFISLLFLYKKLCKSILPYSEP